MRTVSVKLMADISDYQRKMRSAGAEAKTLKSGLDQANKAGRLDETLNAATGLGVGLLGVAATAVKFRMEFDKQMSGVQAATHASAGTMDQFRAAALKAGKDTQYSATQAAQGIEELAKAGISSADILGGGLKGALDLAAAGGLEVGEAAETAASALTQFKLQGKDVPHVADLLAAAAGKAQGSVHDMGMALNQAGLVAAQTGLSIEETTGGLAAFASAGLIGSDAGTSFKQMLLMLQAPSDKTRDLMTDLGVSAYDAQGNFVGLANLAQNLKEKLSTLTPEVRANAMAQIFGADATRAASILYEQGADGINGWIGKTNEAGYAAETAAIKTDNLAGDLERLKGSLETAAIESGGGLSEGLRVLAKGADAAVGALSKLPSGVTATITVAAALGGALILGLVAWAKTRTAIAGVITELNAAGPAGARAATGLSAAGKAAGTAAVAFVAMEVAGQVFDKLGNSAVNVSKLAESLENYAQTGKMSQGITDELGTNFDELALVARSADAATHGFWGGLNDLLTPIPLVGSAVDSMNESLTGTSFNDATDRMSGLDEAFTKFIGTQKDAKKAGELWNEMLLKSGLDAEQFQKLLPQSTAALTELQKASHAGASAQGALGGAAVKTTEQLEAEKEAAAELEKAFDSLFDRYMSADEAALKYEKALTATNKELREGKKALDAQSAAGQANRGATLDLISAIKDQREANINNNMSVADADKKYRAQIETLKKTMINLRYTRKDVERLIDKYRDIPNRVGTTIETPGLPKARTGIKGYDDQLDKLARKVQTDVKVTGDSEAYGKLKRLLVAQQAATKGISISAANSAFNKNAGRGFAAGGRTGDMPVNEVAGVVHGQEMVLNARTVRNVDRQAPGLLDEMHATGQVPGYAGGGRVLPMPFNVNANLTKIISMTEALSKVSPSFSRDWPSSPMAQRGDSGIWKSVLRLIKSGPKSGSFGNAYRPGDPKWHGSGRAVDWMGYRQDALASFLASKRPLELIHRTPSRDYAYTRGRNKGSFNNSLMEAHRNHIHIAMANGGMINEHVFGVGASGNTYEFGENGRSEKVIPMGGGSTGGGGTITNVLNVFGPIGSQHELQAWFVRTHDQLASQGRV